MNSPFRIGARASPLSLAQTQHVRGRLAAALGLNASAQDAALPVLPMITQGDRLQERSLRDAGGKGLFTKELDEALLDRRIDLAVHSLKDLPSILPEGIVLACVPEREDVRDVLIAPGAASLEDVTPGAVLGTASLRRAAQALHQRPDLRIVTMRGNVQTRLDKLAKGVADATFLALAGLKRLGLESAAGALLDPRIMPPAIGQGALAVTARAGDTRVLGLLAELEDAPTRLAIEAERGFLLAVEGDCRTPIAALSTWQGPNLHLLCEALTPDGCHRWRVEEGIIAPDVGSARALGQQLGVMLRKEAGPLWPIRS